MTATNMCSNFGGFRCSVAQPHIGMLLHIQTSQPHILCFDLYPDHSVLPNHIQGLVSEADTKPYIQTSISLNISSFMVRHLTLIKTHG